MQQDIPLFHCPEDRAHLVQERHTHGRRNLLFQLFPLRIRQLDQVLQVVIPSPQYQIVRGNTKGTAYKRQKIFRHIAIVHKPTQGTNLTLFHFLANVFHDIPSFLVIQVNISIS